MTSFMLGGDYGDYSYGGWLMVTLFSNYLHINLLLCCHALHECCVCFWKQILGIIGSFQDIAKGEILLHEIFQSLATCLKGLVTPVGLDIYSSSITKSALCIECIAACLFMYIYVCIYIYICSFVDGIYHL